MESQIKECHEAQETGQEQNLRESVDYFTG
jgi:hypothetical protein